MTNSKASLPISQQQGISAHFSWET